jgi:hypothetical protein
MMVYEAIQIESSKHIERVLGLEFRRDKIRTEDGHQVRRANDGIEVDDCVRWLAFVVLLGFHNAQAGVAVWLVAEIWEPVHKCTRVLVIVVRKREQKSKSCDVKPFRSHRGVDVDQHAIATRTARAPGWSTAHPFSS